MECRSTSSEKLQFPASAIMGHPSTTSFWELGTHKWRYSFFLFLFKTHKKQGKETSPTVPPKKVHFNTCISEACPVRHEVQHQGTHRPSGFHAFIDFAQRHSSIEIGIPILSRQTEWQKNTPTGAKSCFEITKHPNKKSIPYIMYIVGKWLITPPSPKQSRGRK